MFEHYHGSNGKIDFVSSIHSSGIINYRTLGQQVFNLGPWHTYVKVEVRTINKMLVLPTILCIKVLKGLQLVIVILNNIRWLWLIKVILKSL